MKGHIVDMLLASEFRKGNEMEQLVIIKGVEYIEYRNEQGDLLYRYIKSDEPIAHPPDSVNPLTLPTTKGDIKELNELITENTIEVQYLTSLTELGL